jgi:hypothetical protein
MKNSYGGATVDNKYSAANVILWGIWMISRGY